MQLVVVEGKNDRIFFGELLQSYTQTTNALDLKLEVIRNNMRLLQNTLRRKLNAEDIIILYEDNGRRNMFEKVTHRILRETVLFITKPFYVLEIVDGGGISHKTLLLHLFSHTEKALHDNKRYYSKYRPVANVNDNAIEIIPLMGKSPYKIIVTLSVVPRSLEEAIFEKAINRYKNSLKGMISKLKKINVHQSLAMIAGYLGKSLDVLIKESVYWFDYDSEQWIKDIIRKIQV